VEPLSTLSYNTCKENSDVNFFEHFLSYFGQISDIERRVASIRITYEWHTDTYQALQSINLFTLERDWSNVSRDWIRPGQKPGNIRVRKKTRVAKNHRLRDNKPVRFSEQIMSVDKYPSIFSRQMEAVVCIFHNSIHLKAVIWLGIMVLTQISRSLFKQSEFYILMSHIYVSMYFFWWFFGYIWR